MINDPKESVYDVDVIEERSEVLCWTLDESPRIIHDRDIEVAPYQRLSPAVLFI